MYVFYPWLLHMYICVYACICKWIGLILLLFVHVHIHSVCAGSVLEMRVFFCVDQNEHNIIYCLNCYHFHFIPLDESYNPHPFCLVVYYIPSGFSPIVVSNGKLKTAQPYFPTLPSTTLDINKSVFRQAQRKRYWNFSRWHFRSHISRSITLQ